MITTVVSAIAAVVASNTIVDSIMCGVGISTGLYVASRTKKATAMPKKTR